MYLPTMSQKSLTQLPLCPCGRERVRALGQWYGKACHNRASREYRERSRKKLARLLRMEAMLARIETP